MRYKSNRQITSRRDTLEYGELSFFVESSQFQCGFSSSHAVDELEKAYLEAKKLGSNFVGTEHILVGILGESDSLAVRILLDLNVNIENMYVEIAKTLNEFEENIKNDENELNDIRKF